ncbi:MAG: hypothetical protein FJW20_23260 [Acidimicrobiia bacterium]|nr:hypothetical protein [Acidimicrobiia bacterium]
MGLRYIPLLAAALLSAAVVPRLGIEQLVAESPRIVHGRVLGSHTARSGQFIWTHYRFQVLDNWKGDAPAEIIVSEPGGTLDGVTMEISGSVKFQTGEELVLFLYQTPIGYWRTTGYWQGKCSIASLAGEKRVHNNLRHASLVDIDKRPAQAKLQMPDRIRLSEFKSLIQGLGRR